MSFRRRCLALAALFAAPATASHAAAHVGITAPEPDSELYPGEIVGVTWVDQIVHETLAYDLDLVPGGDGEAVPVMHGISAAEKSYEWLVPEVRCDSGCLLYVTQKNAGGIDYFDALPITIASSHESNTPAGASVGAGCSVARRPTPGAVGAASGVGVALAVAIALRRRGRHAPSFTRGKLH